MTGKVKITVTAKKSVKKKIIIAFIVIGALLLLIGSFFLRDIFLRAGITEYEQREILQVKTKYAAVLDSISSKGMTSDNFVITARHGGLFEKSEISGDDNGQKIIDALKEEIDVLCHTYCYEITGRDGAVSFAFNKTGTKQLVYSLIEPETETENDTIENLGENWYYVERA